MIGVTVLIVPIGMRFTAWKITGYYHKATIKTTIKTTMRFIEFMFYVTLVGFLAAILFEINYLEYTLHRGWGWTKLSFAEWWVNNWKLFG